MPNTLPTGTWRDEVTFALQGNSNLSPQVADELNRRHVQFEDLSKGPRYERVVTLSHLGLTATQISAAVGLPYEKVEYLLRSARSDTWRIIEEHLNGYTAQQISDLTEFSKAYVYRILKKYQFRPNVNRAQMLTSRQEEEILRRRREGESQKSISRATGATVSQVKYLLQRRSR
ncbi:MAG: hypothetical protein CMG34_07525 [Candidatus Marinimicrobia bacterium]|nr:hypothetical protein [Candidatus Neomarinimicrobiota bacterium]MBP01048.1 hypothetical protein [Candidatus Neomarinimicrobiota bacterium]|tara:strand:+ start:1624 stop:2145 length:522 start_codon:yes stop_codon:yes gene_type:complete